MGSIHEDRSSPSCIAMCQEWIRACEDEHPRCHAPNLSSPSRRILDCTPDAGVRLCRASKAHGCRYLALSYCWGGTKPLATTVDTLSSHEISIPIAVLPRLYHDVVILARSLEVQYIWIDSLCIVQDDDEDRDHEIRRMGDIFDGAFLVVIAASAPSPRTGILQTALWPWSGPGRSRYVWRDATAVRYDGLNLDKVHFRERIHKHSERDACQRERIMRRAWTYQERLLARRCLVFKEKEIVWECKTWCRCECSGDQSSLPPDRQFQISLLPSLRAKVGAPLRTNESFIDAYTFWKQAVKIFSSRKLGYATDRLPAISALAQEVSGATGDRYLAGLWKSDLVGQLMWQSSPSYDEVEAYKQYIAPSWSWASTPAPTSYVTPPLTSCVDIILAWCKVPGQNPFGPVTDGAIILRGVHCRAEVHVYKNLDTDSSHIGIALDHTDVYDSQNTSSDFGFLDGFRVKPVTMRTRTSEVLKTLQRVPGRQPDEQNPCQGFVHLLWLTEYVCLILAFSQRELGAFERLGILDISMAPPMPDLQPSELKFI